MGYVVIPLAYLASIDTDITAFCSTCFHDSCSKKGVEKLPTLLFIWKSAGVLCSCLLPESIQVTAVKQLPEYHECTGTSYVASSFRCSLSNQKMSRVDI